MDEMEGISSTLSGGLAPGTVSTSEEEKQELEDELRALMQETDAQSASGAYEGKSHPQQVRAPLPAVPVNRVQVQESPHRDGAEQKDAYDKEKALA